MSTDKNAKDSAIKVLRELLPPGTRVYTTLRHRSRSGMQRQIGVLIPVADYYDGRPAIRDISHIVACALGLRRNPDTGGLIVRGAGMDMGFALVYELGSTIYPDGFKLADVQHGRNGDTSGYDKDGGYALSHEWI